MHTHAHDDKTKPVHIEKKLNGNFLLAATVPTCNSVTHKNNQFHLLPIKARSIYLVYNNGLISYLLSLQQVR